MWYRRKKKVLEDSVIFRLDKRRNLEILESSVLEHQGNMLVNYPGNGLNLIATDAGFKKRENLEGRVFVF